MRRLRSVSPGVVFIGLLLLTSVVLAGADSFNLAWWTVDGGGGTSSGGDYTLSGTIGQADAGQMQGGDYQLHGGFWAPIAAAQPLYLPLIVR